MPKLRRDDGEVLLQTVGFLGQDVHIHKEMLDHAGGYP
jgi:hypothetical protein